MTKPKQPKEDANKNNIYYLARKNANFKGTDAIEKVNVSKHSLYAYENDITIPAEDIVAEMIKTYNAPYLGYQHVQSTSKNIVDLPQLKLEDFHSALLGLINQIDKIKKYEKDIIALGSKEYDDSIKDEEIYKKIIKDLNVLLYCIFAFKYHQPKSILRMPHNYIKIRIKKSTGDTWYSNKIGQILDTDRNPYMRSDGTWAYRIFSGGEPTNSAVYADDAEVINSTEV